MPTITPGSWEEWNTNPEDTIARIVDSDDGVATGVRRKWGWVYETKIRQLRSDWIEANVTATRTHVGGYGCGDEGRAEWGRGWRTRFTTRSKKFFLVYTGGPLTPCQVVEAQPPEYEHRFEAPDEA